MSIISERKDQVHREYKPAKLEMINDPEYNSRLTLCIPGTPVSDGRPRKNNELNIFYNEKKEFLKKIFKEVYKLDPLLRRICVVTPFRIVVSTYSYPDKTELKYLTDEELRNETVKSISPKDNDNVEKVNWDVLQDQEFQILLNDRYVVQNVTLKTYSYNPRTVIVVDFNDKFVNKLYEYKILNSMDYRFFLCSKKYTYDMKEMTDEECIRYLSKELLTIKSTATKRMQLLMKGYKVEIINGLFRAFIFGRKRSEKIDRYIKKRNRDYKSNSVCLFLTLKPKKMLEQLAAITTDYGEFE